MGLAEAARCRAYGFVFFPRSKYSEVDVDLAYFHLKTRWSSSTERKLGAPETLHLQRHGQDALR